MIQTNKMAALVVELTTFAFLSRLFVVFIQIVSNAVIPDHDAGVFNPPQQEINDTILDSFIKFSFGGLRRWDAIYFTHISQFGYTYENCVAFFPLFPLITSVFSRLVFILGFLQMPQCVLLAGIVINCTLFSLTAQNLYILGIETGLDKVTSLLSVFVFCLNPASIFMTAPYSEILYFYLLILALLYIKRGFIFRASLIIALSISVRSNGLVGIGFVLYSMAQSFIAEFYSEKIGKQCFRVSVTFIISVVMFVLKAVVCFTICISTFVLYQYYIYRQFCFTTSSRSVDDHLVKYGRDQDYIIVGDPPSSWCFQNFPMSYSYIQSKHWGFGFLKYYRIKQIPNFLLAAPVVFMTYKACRFFYKMDRAAFHTLGFLRGSAKKKESVTNEKSDDALNHPIQSKFAAFSNTKINTTLGQSSLTENLVVYVFHLAFLTVFGCCFIHIQVLTRLLFSSSPLLYWYAGTILSNNRQVRAYLRETITSIHNACLTTSNQEENQKVFGHIFARNHLRVKTEKETKTKPLQNEQKGRLSWFELDYCYKRFVASNICVKTLVFILRNGSHLTMGSKAVLGYCIAYVLVGTCMFSNFLPWT